MKMIKSIKIEVGDTVLDIRIDHVCTLRDELNALFSPVATNKPHPTYALPRTTTAETFQPSYSTAPINYGANATTDETWSPAG